MILAIAAAATAVSTTPALPLKPCVLPGFASARCGSLAVREDRRIANGRKIRLFVGVLRAYGPRPHREPIFYLSGGPGGAAASADAGFASRVFLSANQTRDIVLVDQRGVGKSAPLLCKETPQTIEDAQGCLRAIGRDPRLYTTDAAMDDVDAVRRALHYRRIVIYGGSYGGTAAQVYLTRHGSQVAAAVLDGATLLNVPIFEQMPLATQRAFDRLAERCAGDLACKAAFPDVAGDLHVVLARLRASPIHYGTGTFDVSGAQETLRLLLRVPESAARVPRILHSAAGGDYREFLTAWALTQEGGVDTAPPLMYWAILCTEGWARYDAAEVLRWGADTEFLEASINSAQTLQAVCPLLGTPFPSPDTGTLTSSRVPVLFLVGAMDPQDPIENVAAAPETLPNAEILVVPGAGHGSVQLGCVPGVATRFFARHHLTAADRACAASVRPPPFETP